MNSLRRLFQPVPSDVVGGASLALKLTALILILDRVPIWYIGPLVVFLAALMLFFPPLLRLPAAWGAIVLLTLARVIRLWPMVDNHHYLTVYWTLAIFIALHLPRPDEALGTSARWLVVFVFVWATLWKAVLSPDYMDGRFYRARLLTDNRFAEKSMVLGGLTREDYLRNRAYVSLPDTVAGENSGPPSELKEPRAFSRLVRFLTWGTVIFEGLVALAFLLPWGRWTALVRHGSILIFCATAYLIAPVSAFGWLLLAMGLAQAHSGPRALKAAYLTAFFLIDFYANILWQDVLIRLRSLLPV